MAHTIGMAMLHNAASDMVSLFNHAIDFPGSPAARLVLTYRASYQGMDKCFARDDFWKWSALSAECDAALYSAGILANDPMPAAGEADASPKGK